MLRLRKTIDPDATRAKLDALAGALQAAAEGAEPDPFDDAMLSAIFGLVELWRTHARVLADLEAQTGKLARRR